MRRAVYAIATLTVLTIVTPKLWSQGICNQFAPPLTINVAANPSPVVFGQNLTVNVVANQPCGPAQGFVELVVDGTVRGNPVAVDANGLATFSIPDSNNGIPAPGTFLAPGVHTVGVDYGGFTECSSGLRAGLRRLAPRLVCGTGNYAFQSASSNQINLGVTKANTSTSLASGSVTSVTATVSVAAPGSGTPIGPTGTVSFFNNGAQIGTAALTGGQATLNVANQSGFVTATYGGDVNFSGSGSNAVHVGPPLSSVVTVSSSANPATVGQSVTFTATLAVANGNGPGTGSIQFSDGSISLGAPVPLSGGQASITTSKLAVGSHTINAAYSGDIQYPSAGGSVGQVVNRISTTLSVTNSPTTPLSNQTVTISAQLGPQPPTGIPNPTGQITFTEGTNQLGVTAVSSASATFQLGPLSAGTHQLVAVYSGDADWSSARVPFSITVNQGALAITTETLPNGTSGAAYSASVAASGGAPPYTFSGTLPPKLTIDSATGAITGVPAAAGPATVTINVQDSATPPATVSKQFTIQIASGPLSISTISLPNGTTGTAYSASVFAVGGTPPYTFSGTLPSGLTINSTTGAITGIPAGAGPATVTINVKDSATPAATASKNFSVNFGLPAVPPVTITPTGNTGPAQQPALQINLGGSFPVTITGTLTLTFQADKGGDNPEVQFAAGGRSIPFTIPVNSNSITTPPLQTGTVAGLITVTAHLQAGTTDVTPAPVPSQTIRINAAPPAISVTAVRTAAGFTVTVTGFSTTVDMTQATFQFNGAAGTNLQTPSLTIQLAPLFSAYYQTATPGATGSQFVYTQPFNVSGGGTIASVTVTLQNSNGTSQTATATIQ